MTLQIRAERADPRRRRPRPKVAAAWRPPERAPDARNRASEDLRDLSDDEVLLVPARPDPVVSRAHDIADEAEATLRDALADEHVTVRALPSWGREGIGAPTLSVELPAESARALVLSVRRVVELGERRRPPVPGPLPPEDDWLLAGGWER